MQIPVAANGAAAGSGSAGHAARLLRTLPEVRSVRVLARREVLSLLEPWIGELARAGELPIPAVIDVGLAEGHNISAGVVAERLAAVAPEAVVDDHGVWLADLLALARTIQIVALVAVALIGLSAVAAVVFATRSGLSVHLPIIELLHYMGAQDSYVSRQFERHALRMGARGGLIGAVMALAVLFAVGHAAGGIDAAFLPDPSLSAAQWAALATVPLAMVVIAVATARFTAMQALARMP